MQGSHLHSCAARPSLNTPDDVTDAPQAHCTTLTPFQFLLVGLGRHVSSISFGLKFLSTLYKKTCSCPQPFELYWFGWLLRLADF